MLAEEIIKEAKENAKETLKKAEEIVSFEKERLKKELEAVKKEKIEEKKRELEEKEKEFLASLELEKKRMLKEAEERLFKKFLELLSEELLNNDRFWNSLAKKAKEVANKFSEEYVVYITKGKKKYFSGLKNVEEKEDIIGFKIVSKDGVIEYDSTLSVILERNKNPLRKMFQKHLGI